VLPPRLPQSLRLRQARPDHRWQYSEFQVSARPSFYTVESFYP